MGPSFFDILIVDDYEPWRSFCAMTPQKQPGLQVVGQVADGLEAVRAAQKLRPDLILLDIGIPLLNGIEAARRIRDVSPNSRILCVSERNSRDIVKEGRNRHEVMFYSDDRAFLDGLSRFIGTALNTGNGAIVGATESHREGLLQRLEAFGVNRSGAEGRYNARDVANTVSEFLTDAARHVTLFSDLIETAKQAATADHPRVVLFGEGVDLLCRVGHFKAAMQAEKIAAQLVEKYDVDMMCGYSLSGFQGETDAPVVQQICREHTAVHPG